MRLNDEKKALLKTLTEQFGTVVTRKQVLGYLHSQGKTVADARWIFNNKVFRAGRGQYDLTAATTAASGSAAPAANVKETEVPAA